jgi:hypothetical protein
MANSSALFGNLFGGGGNANSPSQSTNSNTNSGLMGLYTNPQIAGLLGMSQGLLAASGASRLPVSMGQAMGQGLGGMQQGAGNALQAQRQMMQMQAMQGILNGGAQGGGAGGQNSQGPQAPVGASTAPGVSAPPGVGMGLLGNGSTAAAAQPAAAGAPGSPPLIMGKTPAQLWQQGLMMNMAGIQGGGDLMKLAVQYDPTLQAQMPTDITKMATQAGMTPQQAQAANAAGITKATATQVRPGGGVMVGNQFMMTPGAAPTGYMNQQNPDGSWGVVPIAGGLQAVGNTAAAKTAGEGSALPYAGVDAQGNPLPVTNRTAAATGSSLPLPLRNNNPGAVSPGGQVASYPDMQTGLQKMDTNLASYAGQPDAATLGGVINKWVGSPANAPAYVNDVTSRLGVPANTPVDLTNPAQRQAISTAIMLHENGPKAIFGTPTQGAAGQSGPIYASPPLGVTAAANASQGAPSQQMANSYSALSNGDANYQQSREALTEMMGLANNKGVVGAAAGLLPESVGTKLSPDAATYQKAHATYVALQGKALGSGGTDASRATLDEAVPTYDKPQAAMVTGLTNQLNNLDLNHIKTQFLTPIYQQGDEKQFTAQSAAFDNNITPKIVPLLTMPPGAARAAALQQVITTNPSIKPNLNWAIQSGILR